MSDETTLLSCPFCGGEAYTCVDHEETHIPVLQHLVQCGCCWATTDKYDTEAEAIDAWNTRAHGTLTAEQVREAIMSADRWEKPMGNTGMTNTHLIIRDDGWQAIADELNKLGSKTCELIDRGKFTPHHDFHRVECSVLFWQSHGHLPPARFCPSCGKRCIHNE